MRPRWWRAVAAVVAGTFSFAGAAVRFVAGAAGGIAIGLAVGWLAGRIRSRTSDAQLNVLSSLLTGYVAYIPADAVGASGVLSTVAAGIYMGVRGPGVLPVRARLQGFFVWDLLDFVLNATLFVLIGLQLRAVAEGLAGYSARAVAGVVVATRLIWFFTVPYAVWAINPRSAPRAHSDDARRRFVLAWSGMRGAVSLAVALALPATTHTGTGFPLVAEVLEKSRTTSAPM